VTIPKHGDDNDGGMHTRGMFL